MGEALSAAETYYDVAMRRLESEMVRIDALDRKAALVLATAVALLPLFGVILTSTARPPRAAIVFYALAVLAYLVMVGCAIASTRIGHWSGRPDLTTLALHARTNNAETVRWWVATECMKSVEANRPKLRAKALQIDYTFALLLVVALLLALAALIDLTA